MYSKQQRSRVSRNHQNPSIFPQNLEKVYSSNQLNAIYKASADQQTLDQKSGPIVEAKLDKPKPKKVS